MDTGAVAETERLVIRRWRLEEAPRLLDIPRRPEVVRWLDDDPHRPITAHWYAEPSRSYRARASG